MKVFSINFAAVHMARVLSLLEKLSISFHVAMFKPNLNEYFITLCLTHFNIVWWIKHNKLLLVIMNKLWIFRCYIQVLGQTENLTPYQTSQQLLSNYLYKLVNGLFNLLGILYLPMHIQEVASIQGCCELSLVGGGGGGVSN